MAQAVPNPPGDRRRVKVYELRNNDWYDRGTGFCFATGVNDNPDGEPRIIVEAEDENAPEKILLETIISKQSQFQKQQDTLIVWTEPSTCKDMALSFQEAEGCTSIWKFINSFNTQLLSQSADDVIDDLHSESYNLIKLPKPALGNIKDIDDEMRIHSNTAIGREGLVKFVLQNNYIRLIVELVEWAEDLEDLQNLHRLCNIVKTLILLNDNDIVEYCVRDDVILGVVGALEYDPDFPSHKANHRQWLSDESRYREVVQIQDEMIRKKIHHTYRLQYLKDVVLARILDDPTFSILNSLIFYYQVDILHYIQNSPEFMKELFSIFNSQQSDEKRKKDAVLFIQQSCAIAKNLQPQAKTALYNNLLGHGLLPVIIYALRHEDVGVRVGATDVLVAIIDHDPHMIRQTIFRQINEKKTPLTDVLIELLLVEVDLGVKAQIADAIKVLLDPGNLPPLGPQDMARSQMELNRLRQQSDPQQDIFLANFYENSAKRLFSPLVQLKDRQDMDLNIQQLSLFEHLIEILWFFIRQHAFRSKYFILENQLCQRIAQLFKCREKYLKLSCLRFFRNLMQLNEEFYNEQMITGRLFLPIIDLLVESMPRDNLLNSACLEFFEFICLNNLKNVITHLVAEYRDKLSLIDYVSTFKNMIQRFDHAQFQGPNMEGSFMDTEEDTPGRNLPPRNTGTWQGLQDLDPREEDYFNTSDDEDEMPETPTKRPDLNGASPAKPLVDYPSDEENEVPDKENMADKDLDSNVEMPDASSESQNGVETGDNLNSKSPVTPLRQEDQKENESPSPLPPTPPERLSEKRRREEEEDDELSKLASRNKRRSSSSVSQSSPTPGLVKQTIKISTKAKILQ